MFIVSQAPANVHIFAKDNNGAACNAAPIYYHNGQITVTNTAGSHITFGTDVGASVYSLPHINNANRTSAGVTTLFVNRNQTGVSTILQQGGAYGQPQLGGRHDYGCAYLPQDVEIPEAIFYSGQLTATERLKVNSYLALKYGITLNQTTATDYLASNGTTRMWTAVDNVGYNKDIAGIGKDSCNGSLLHQKQSKSVNAGALLTMAVGNAVAYSNNTNTSSIINNYSFLTWGDNGGATTFLNNVISGYATVRMARVWKADKTTNWIDEAITIKFGGSARNTYLLISNSDPSFGIIDQELAFNDDSTITFNSSLLPDGAYFTFAKEIRGPGYVNSGVKMWLRADDGTLIEPPAHAAPVPMAFPEPEQLVTL
jgi:hypothetical protein